MSPFNDDTFNHYIQYLMDEAGLSQEVATGMAENLLLRKPDLHQQHYERINEAYVRVEDKHLEFMGLAAAILPMLAQKAKVEARDFAEVWHETRNLSLGFASGFKQGLTGEALSKHAHDYQAAAVRKRIAS